MFVRQPTLSLLVYSETEGELFCGQVISRLRFTLKGGDGEGEQKEDGEVEGLVGEKKEKERRDRPFIW